MNNCYLWVVERGSTDRGIVLKTFLSKSKTGIELFCADKTLTPEELAGRLVDSRIYEIFQIGEARAEQIKSAYERWGAHRARLP